MNSLTMTLLSLSLSASLGAVDYYLSQDGDDRRDGRTPEGSWRTLERVPARELKPGDRVLLRGGDRFHGQLALSVSGEAQHPITIASWGTGSAIILPPPGANGITVTDAGFIVVRNLHIAGPGTDASTTGSGVLLYANQRRSSGVVLRNLVCSGFPKYGIEMWSGSTESGFEDVLIDRVECHGSGEGGMGSWGPVKGTTYSFHRVVVRDSVFHGNRGRPAKQDNHSGNGIILGDCQDALIERCAAWGNGDLCNSAVGGPVGIWLCESDRSVIRACVSFRNRTGAGVPDGGGFDLDGGCTGCVIEDCLSWRNDGAGYLVCQYGGARPLRGNIIRNCWSVGDGRARNNGAFYVVGEMTDILITGCTAITDPSPTHATCWRVLAGCTNLQLRNNLSIALDAAPLFPDPRLPSTTYGGNQWWPVAGFEVPTGDAASTATPVPSIPVLVDETWLASLAQPSGSSVVLEPRWQAILTAARCVAATPERIGARAIPRYGPAAY